MKGSSSSASSVRVINELDAFEPNFKTPDSPPNATYRKLWEVKFFDRNLEVRLVKERGMEYWSFFAIA